MNTLILYESKHGATKRVATHLMDALEHATLAQATTFEGNLATYDHIVLASPVYVGQIHKAIKERLDSDRETLLARKLTIVLCAMNKPEWNNMIESNLDDDIRKHAQVVHAGGAYDFTSLSWFERLVVKVIAKVKTSVDAIDYEALREIQ